MDSLRTALEIQIAQEAKELAEVPKIPIQRFLSGPTARCGMCGGVVAQSSLQPIDQHIPNIEPRQAGPCCHPNRGANAGN